MKRTARNTIFNEVSGWLCEKAFRQMDMRPLLEAVEEKESITTWRRNNTTDWKYSLNYQRNKKRRREQQLNETTM